MVRPGSLVVADLQNALLAPKQFDHGALEKFQFTIDSICDDFNDPLIIKTVPKTNRDIKNKGTHIVTINIIKRYLFINNGEVSSR